MAKEGVCGGGSWVGLCSRELLRLEKLSRLCASVRVWGVVNSLKQMNSMVWGGG